MTSFLSRRLPALEVSSFQHLTARESFRLLAGAGIG